MIKTIWTAALNVEPEDITLTKKQISEFKKHRKNIAKLRSPKFSVREKRQFLTQYYGAFPIIPILLCPALRPLGSQLFKGRR